MRPNWMRFNLARRRRVSALLTAASTAAAMGVGALLISSGSGAPAAADVCNYVPNVGTVCIPTGGGGGGGGTTTTSTTLPGNPDPYGPRRGAAMTDKIVYTSGSPVTVTAPAPSFKPGSAVTIEIRHIEPSGPDTSTPGGNANADGSFSGQSVIPPNDPTGVYLVFVTGTAPDGTPVVLEVVIIVSNPGGAAATQSAGPPASAAAAGSAPAGVDSSASAVPAITPSGVAAAQAAAFPGGSVGAAPAAAPAAPGQQLAAQAAAHRAADASNRKALGVLAGLVALLGMAALWLPRRRTADR